MRKPSTSDLGAAARSVQEIAIEQPRTLGVFLEITGTAPIIQNNFGQKTIEEMLKKHMGITTIREKKKPSEACERAKIYNLDKRICMPPIAFKKAMLTAASLTKSLKKTNLRQSIFIEGQSVPITFSREEMRMDMVRTSGMTRQPDIRFRPMFHDWKARLAIFFSDSISVQSVVDLVNRSGSCGVGEWRPERNGTFGTFVVTRNITDKKEQAAVRRECASPLVPLVIPDWARDSEIDPEMLSKIFSNEEEHALRGPAEVVEEELDEAVNED